MNFLKSPLVLIIACYCSYAYSESCPGYVYEMKIGTASFNGYCNSDGNRESGTTTFENGDSYAGYYYKNGNRRLGTYYYADNDTLSGIFMNDDLKHTNNGMEYDLIGKLSYKKNGNLYSGYMLGPNLNGFGGKFFDEEDFFPDHDRETEIGVYKVDADGNSTLNGYGVRVFATGEEWYAYWEGGAIFGDGYKLDKDGNTQKWNRSIDGSTSGPYALTSSDRSRLKKIQNFITDNLTEINNKFDEYDRAIAVFNNEEDPEKKIQLNNDSSDLVQSIQQLLTELGYSPGPSDGIIGKRTIAAIKAFQYEMDIDMTGEVSEELLVGLQLAIKYSSDGKNIVSKDSDPRLLGTGTGFYINETNIVSNNHVVDQCEYLLDENENKLNVVMVDVSNDLAILSGPATENFLSISSLPPDLGEKVYVAGYPYNSLLEGFNFTSGNVSSIVGFKRNSSNFKITAPIQPGNSGGPILNEQSAVIGVVVARIDDEYVLESTGTLPQNINIGIKNSVLKTLLLENNIESTLKTPFFKRSQQNIAEASKNASVLIKCYGKTSK